MGDHCAHLVVWPDGTCVDCGVLATLFPGLSEAHTVRPRPQRNQIDILASLKQSIDERDAERKAAPLDRQNASSGLAAAEQSKKESQ